MRTAQEIPDQVTTTDLPAIKVLLDGYLRDPRDPEKFCALMLLRCRGNPDTIWELLALIDQCERRGQAGSQEFRVLKTALGREACGRPMPDKVGLRKHIPSATRARQDPEPTEQISARHAINAEPTELTVRPSVFAEPAELAPVRRKVEALRQQVAGFPHSAAPRAKSAQAVSEPTDVQKRIPQQGMVLRNRFVLEDVLGSGGMGRVYRAFDRNRLDLPEQERYVALKVLREDLATRPEALDRLKREFHQTQRLSHPGIVNVFDLDSEAGIHFITMELLHGELLCDVLARILPEQLDRRAAFTLLRDLGNAVSYAHECGIVHADLKPGNVMLTLQGELRVLDFGLAMPLVREPWISNWGDSFQGVTRTYASCERLAGDSPDVRDDVFSYACMAYELLAGKHPFSRRPATEARSEGMPLRRIPGLSRRQWQALKKGLEWERADRPESLAELVADLVPESFPRYLPPPYELESRPPARGNAGTWLATGAIVLVAAVSLIAWVTRDANLSKNLAASVLHREDLAGGFASAATKELDHWRERFRRAPARDRTTGSDEPLPLMDAARKLQIERVPGAAAPVSDPPQTAGMKEKGAVVALPPASPANEVRAPGILAFSRETLQISESSSVARLVVHRSGASNQTASFSWHTVAGSATEDLDYAAFGTVTETFAPGQTDVAVLVPIVRDSIREGVETFDVEILEASGQLRLGPVTRANVVIDDSDEITVNRQ